MLAIFRTTGALVLFAALYALATVMLGFGHRTAVDMRSASALAEAYVLPGGIVPSLCDDGVAGRGHVGDHGCDACRIADAPGLDAPAEILLPMPTGGRAVAVALAESVVVVARLHRPGSRGPPALAAST